MFIIRALEKILGDIKRSHHSQLKKACEDALGEQKSINYSDQCHFPRSSSIFVQRTHVSFREYVQKSILIINVYLPA